jgi:hypothetical protein
MAFSQLFLTFTFPVSDSFSLDRPPILPLLNVAPAVADNVYWHQWREGEHRFAQGGASTAMRLSDM